MPFWPSPISTRDVAGSGVRPGWPTIQNGRLWWTEERPDEGGRTTIVSRTTDGTPRELLRAPWSARTRVHEYGGMPYAVTPAGEVVFANLKDQRLYVLGENGDPKPLTPEGDRYADLLVRDGQVWCVRERHAEAGKVTRAIVSIPLDGGEIREWATGYDFYASPALSPDGRHLAYVCWDHPRMPWEGTELRITHLPDDAPPAESTPKPGDTSTEPAPRPEYGSTEFMTGPETGTTEPTPGAETGATEPAPRAEEGDSTGAVSAVSWKVRGGPAESVLAPSWKDDSHLYLISDRSGWWNLYEIGLHGDGLRALHPAEEEFVLPPWRLGGRPYAVLGDGRLAVVHGRGDLRLGVLDPDSGTLADLDVPYAGWDSALAAEGTSVVGIGYAPTIPQSVVTVDAATGGHRSLRRALTRLPEPHYLPVPQAVRVPGREEVHAFLYPPYPAAADQSPPYVVFVHGGPTAHAGTALDLEKAFLTSRGIGVLDVNYGGSTGYGRAYRERLKGQWGLVDVADTVAAAEWLGASGLADPARIAVRGASAGGWTVMAACCRSRVFAGGVSYFGISALGPLVAHTHDFESRYVEWLVGPEDPQVYATREPLALVGGVSCPMLLLQGLDDPVVPPEQSSAFSDALLERGISCTYLAFEGESHGFRRTETRVAALAAELAFYQRLFS
ncbi:S9 family peptidase [Nonomuraea jiangxiensis]|uniref:Prolyl oligopeptidase family protein n=1 Tax=Nonomuraea jiangxiensis TaxID=633440 RepID=A0A1G7YA84_9ACTN|nr:prolyl oligopeptidase family serine peptidase [Nonomuraea jiangxiensis]SDG93314.1 Prolyl oligopeptidase family protein [Nonomuraea jiangxiensis]